MGEEMQRMDQRDRSIYLEVLEAVRGRGRVSKQEIDEIWSLTHEQYAELKHFMARQTGIDPGPRRIGGFVVHQRAGQLPEEPVEPEPFDSTLWEVEGARRLTELLQHKELEELLGDLVYTVRVARKAATGEDRRGTRVELARALLTKLGVDLFADSDVRHLVGRKCGVETPGKWHPGKTGAVNFVKQVGFPIEFAGIPSEDPPEEFEHLDGRFDLRPLKDFQEEVKRKLIDTLDKPAGRAIVTLPTGAGKTRVAVEGIRDWLTRRFGADGDRPSTVIWLAHSGELCDQAYAEFRQVWQASSSVCPLLLFRFWGRFNANLVANREALSDILRRPSVIVSTPQRFINLIEDAKPEARDLRRDLLRTVALVMVDEAHRAAAPSYKRIFDYLGAAPQPVVIAGLTATPFRNTFGPDQTAGARELKKLFANLIEAECLGDDPRETLQGRQILARPVVETIQTNTLLTAKTPRGKSQQEELELTDDDIERIDQELSLRADRPQRRLVVLQHVLSVCHDPKNSVLYFGPSVLDAECMAFLLRQEGVPAAVVSGSTREVTRRKLISDFKAKRLRVLCNCEVLTTGFDAPRVTHLVMARPTVSRVLYEQMVGRGLRGSVFGGTDECVIIDCEDNYKDADRLPLGYKDFRDIWKPKRRLSSVAASK
jgi:DNA repair protein RadD